MESPGRVARVDELGMLLEPSVDRPGWDVDLSYQKLGWLDVMGNHVWFARAGMRVLNWSSHSY